MGNKILLVLFLLFSINCWAGQQLDTNIIGKQEIYKIQRGDNLFNIARSNNLSILELLLANPQIIDPQSIYYDKNIILPLAHILPNVLQKDIVINLAEARLYYFIPGGDIFSVPIAIGAEGSGTPTGKTQVIRKRKDPHWIPPDRIREKEPNLPKVVPAGPDNPLGKYALDLSWTRFVIHGTNNPLSIGNKESHGCIRLYPEAIEALFNLVEVGTKVRIVDQPIKIGWVGNKIYIESHLSEDKTEDLDSVKNIICSKVKNCDAKIDWQKVRDTIGENSGMPAEVGSNSND